MVSQRNHLHHCIAYFAQEAVDHGAVQQYVPSRAGRLTEHNVGYSFSLGEINQRVGASPALELNYPGAELFGKSSVLDKTRMILGIYPARFLSGRFHINR